MAELAAAGLIVLADKGYIGAGEHLHWSYLTGIETCHPPQLRRYAPNSGRFIPSRHQPTTRVNTELCVDPLKMVFNGFNRQGQVAGDCFVAVPSRSSPGDPCFLDGQSARLRGAAPSAAGRRKLLAYLFQKPAGLVGFRNRRCLGKQRTCPTRTSTPPQERPAG